MLNINSIAVWSCHMQCTWIWIWIRADGKSYITIMLYAQNVHKHHAVYLCLVVGEIFMCSFFLHPANQTKFICLSNVNIWMFHSYETLFIYTHHCKSRIIYDYYKSTYIYIIRMWWFHTDICEDPMQFNSIWVEIPFPFNVHQMKHFRSIPIVLRVRLSSGKLEIFPK